VISIKRLSDLDINNNWRFEFKYRLNYLQYQKLKIAVLPFMKMDYYTRIAPKKKYLVRSLYYDTYDYSLYHEKMGGDSDRVKFRLRTYSQSVAEDTVVRAELKVRQADIMDKYSLFISQTEYNYFLQKHHWQNNDNPVLSEFERYYHLKALKPQILVDYYREGYEDRNKDGLRVTFDHKVRSAHGDALFTNKPLFFKEHHPLGIVLEVKCRNKQPDWLRNLVRDHGLKLVANSKFAQGIQVARQDLFYPNGVVVVR